MGRNANGERTKGEINEKAVLFDGKGGKITIFIHKVRARLRISKKSSIFAP